MTLTAKGLAPLTRVDPSLDGEDLASYYASLAAAVTAIGSDVTTLRISTPQFPNGTTTGDPITLTLEFVGNGSLAIDSGEVVTILSGSEDWPIKQLFYGTGTVSFIGNQLVKTVYPQWWGASGARSTTAIPTSFTSISGAAAAGATSITVASSTGFSQFGTVKITGAGPSGALYRGIITAIAGTTWTMYPALHTATTNASIHHGDNNITTRTSGAVSAAATVIPVVSSASFYAGQDVYISASGAASGSSNLHEIRTISSVSGNNITLTAGITNGISADALVMHDDSRAINLAINACKELDGAEIFIPAGTYMINGPTLNSQNARLALPAIATGVIIKMRGPARAVPNFPAFITNHDIATEGAILQTDAYNGCLIGGINSGNFTAAGLELEDITLRAYDNPKCIGLNADWLIFLDLHRVMIDTASQTGAVTQPTESASYGVIMPRTANGGSIEIDDIWVIGGWYTGVKLDEHSRASTITSFGNYNGYEIGGNIHPLSVDRLCAHECTYFLNITAACKFTIKHMIIERRWSTSALPSWLNTTAEINDPNNYGAGEVFFSVMEGFNNVHKPFVKIGGLYIRCFPITWPPDAAIGRIFSDNFNDNDLDTHKWSTGSLVTNSAGDASGTVTEANSRTEIAPQASVAAARYRGGVTRDPIDMTGRRVKVKVSQVASNGAETILCVGLNYDNTYFIDQTGSSITFYKRIAGTANVIATTTYNSTNHLWWSIRETDGTFYAEVSADGSSWTVLGSAGFEFWVIQGRASLEAGVASSIGTPGTAWFDDFSIA